MMLSPPSSGGDREAHREQLHRALCHFDYGDGGGGGGGGNTKEHRRRQQFAALFLACIGAGKSTNEHARAFVAHNAAFTARLAAASPNVAELLRAMNGSRHYCVERRTSSLRVVFGNVPSPRKFAAVRVKHKILAAPVRSGTPFVDVELDSELVERLGASVFDAAWTLCNVQRVVKLAAASHSAAAHALSARGGDFDELARLMADGGWTSAGAKRKTDDDDVQQLAARLNRDFLRYTQSLLILEDRLMTPQLVERAGGASLVA